MHSKNVLLISYLFPPLGGAGVQRNLKYVKYLPHYGWRTFVLTVKNIEYHIHDESLTREIPPEVIVRRTGSLDPLRIAAILSGLYHRILRRNGSTLSDAVAEKTVPRTYKAMKVYRKMRDFLAFPDAQAAWIPFAYHHGMKLIKDHDIRVIMASVDPLSSAVVARLLSYKTGLPYLLDFRDGWTDNPYFSPPTALHRRAHVMLERCTVGPANAIGVYGDCLGQALEARYVSLARKIHVLPNGYDADDASQIRPAPRTGVPARRIVYTGSLYEHHRSNLASFLAALRRLPQEILQSLEVIFIGNVYAGAQEEISAAGLDSHVQCIGYRSHAEALGFLRSADAALLFIRSGDVTSNTGKVFEYLMFGCPILACIEPAGSCAQLLRRAGNGKWVVPPLDAGLIAEMIAEIAQLGWPRPDSGGSEYYSRKHIAGHLASILDSIAQQSQPSDSRSAP